MAFFWPDRGHLAPANDRTRSKKDVYATFLTSNIVPQDLTLNRGLWKTFEGELQTLAWEEKYRHTIFITAGVYGSGGGNEKYQPIVKLTNSQSIEVDPNRFKELTAVTTENTNNKEKITVPSGLWKVVIGYQTDEHGKYNLEEEPLYHFAILTPNNVLETRDEIDYKNPAKPKEKPKNLQSPSLYWSIGELEKKLNEDLGKSDYSFRYNFLSDLNLEEKKKDNIRTTIKLPQNILNPSSAKLLAETDSIIPTTSIWHSSISENDIFKTGISSINKVSSSQVGAIETSSIQISTAQISPIQISFKEDGFTQNSAAHISPTQISIFESSTPHIRVAQISPTQVGFFKMGALQVQPSQVSLAQIDSLSTVENTLQVSKSEVRSTQVNPTQISVSPFYFNPNKISLTSSIVFQQLFNTHISHTATTPFPNIYNSNLLLTDPKNPYSLWERNPFNLTLEITDLPTGQLAEAQVTHYTDQGIPNGGTILIDHNANEVGWFIDPTPFDHSEFTQTLTDTALSATADSVAYGKYDLLTAILHEMGHLAGFIRGYTEFDRHIQNNKTFIGDNFTATLTPDGSHLDPTAHPYDLMNNSLKPGIRKLPSLLDLQILNFLHGSEGVREEVSEGLLTAPLTSTPLYGINNGTFDTLDTWSTRGAANIIEGQAVLTEESRFNSTFTQDFIIPDQAKYLQFIILESDLDSSNLAPGDAFEVALLNTNTFAPLVGTATGINQTDALLNIQHDGNAYFADKVKLGGAQSSGNQIDFNSTRTVTIDIRDIAPNTEATLYFDLLGFGSKESKVIIDNVRILTSDILIPVANNDKVSTNQGQPITINVLDNDSGADGTINPSTLQIETAPTNGTITINDDSTITYTPSSNQPGTDSFTYTVQDNEGNTLNTATVSITINNTAPSINQITVEPILSEGIAATFSAIATDLDELTYTWNFGDNTEPVTGASVSHIFADNGSYTATLTVTDSFGASTVETLTLTVNNVAPTVNAGDDQTTVENQSITFNGSYTDPGILDTHTINWDFGDGTVIQEILAPIHTYTAPGTYIATLTVTDKDGGTSSDTLQISVNNAAPVIIELTGNTNINEGETANFNATATGDELTYTWDFGDDSDTASGVTVNHQFADNGTYLVTLTVANGTGSTTSQTLTVNVDNVAPVVNAGDNQITLEGTTVNFNGSFTDPGILDTHTIEWDFGDGNTVTDVLEPSHNYSQNGTYTVTLTITDSDGASTIDTLTVTVNNSAPVITEIIGDTNINEGDTANFSATATDPGNDTLTYTWDFGDGSTPQLGNNVNHKYLDNGTYIATLTITDSDGASTTQTRTIQVNNVAPIIGTITGNTTVKKGDTATFSAIANDSGNDTLTYSWNFGDGSQIQTGAKVNHIFTQTGEFTVILTVTDSDGASTQQTFAVQAIPTAPKYAIRSEKQVRINNGGDLDGNPLDLNDDALIYAAKGFTINGDITLPAKQDANGNPLRNSSGQLILIDNAVTVAPNYTTINANNNQYANLVPPQVVEQQVIDIPAYGDLKQQKLDSVIPSGTSTVTFNSSQNPLNNSQDWANKFPAPGTASNPRVVRVTGGGLNIPDNINISNYVITVDNGDINFNGSNHNFNNVVLISNNGNINLSGVRATNLSVFASGSINMNSQARFAASTLLASGSTNGSINFNGATTSINGGDNLKVVSAGRITFNAASNSRGSMSSVGDFTFNNNSTLYGTIAAKGNVTFNNGANVVYTAL